MIGSTEVEATETKASALPASSTDTESPSTLDSAGYGDQHRRDPKKGYTRGP